jgi:hypothetical protein
VLNLLEYLLSIFVLSLLFTLFDILLVIDHFHQGSVRRTIEYLIDVWQEVGAHNLFLHLFSLDQLLGLIPELHFLVFGNQKASVG